VRFFINGGRVARWFVFKPKIQIWVIFGGSWIGRCLYILWKLSLLHGPLLYFMHIWYICGNLEYFSRFGVLFQEKSGNPEWGNIFCFKNDLGYLPIM
jgi:hypothetical protein